MKKVLQKSIQRLLHIHMYRYRPSVLVLYVMQKEHIFFLRKAEEIALDHLAEDPEYYTKLDKAGLEESHDANEQWS